LIFALRPLLALRRISPLQTLRRESDASVMRIAQRDSAAMVVSLAIVASVLVIAFERAGDPMRALGYSAGVAVAIGSLWITAVLLSKLARRAVRPALPFVARQGVANLYRPGNQTRSVILALGFGVFLISTLYQVQKNLLRQLDLKLEQAQANVVFFDVQESQQPGLDSIIQASGHRIVQEAPIIPTRIAAINDKPVSRIMAERDSLARVRERAGRDPRAQGTPANRGPAPWALRREYRSSYRAGPATSEKIIAGAWWQPGDTTPQISVEKDLASELKVGVGDRITWNVQGVQITTRVASLRDVTWARFEPNFFVVFNPAALEHAPKQFAILVSVPTSNAIALLQRDVVRRYPNVSSLDLSLIQNTVNNVIGKVTSAIRFMALISLAFGIPVLFSAVAATRRDRLREGVLLKTLGATRRQVGRIMLSEY